MHNRKNFWSTVFHIHDLIHQKVYFLKLFEDEECISQVSMKDKAHKIHTEGKLDHCSGDFFLIFFFPIWIFVLGFVVHEHHPAITDLFHNKPMKHI